MAQTSKKQFPTLIEEIALFEQGYLFIAGLDEVGRGCLAGPVVAAAAILSLADETLVHLAGVNDSKQVAQPTRERLYDQIMQHAITVGVGYGSVEIIDERNILQATKYAMEQAIEQLSPAPHALLLDAILLPKVALPQRSIIKGDARCLSIAAASIIAKVTRDRLMLELHKQHPEYGFDKNKGYGTPTHLAALRKYGATPLHRRSFAPVGALFGLFAEEKMTMEAEDGE